MSVEKERAYWGGLADADGPLRAAWGDPASDGIDHCLGMVMPAIAGGLGPGGRVLDLGCGGGRLAIPIARCAPAAHLFGVDSAPAMIGAASRDAQDAEIYNVSWLVNDGRMIPALGPIDAAYSVLVFQHLPGPVVRAYIDQVLGMLAPGGTFRFQWVTGNDEHPGEYSYDHRAETLLGGHALGVDALGVDPVFDEWRWATLTKPTAG